MIPFCFSPRIPQFGKMNDRSRRSLRSYLDLKKEDDDEAKPEIEMVQQRRYLADERNLATFFKEIAPIKADMEEINDLLVDIEELYEKTKSTHSATVLGGLRDGISSYMATILRKASIIQGRLELLDKSNLDNRSLSDAFKEGTTPDRTRMLVTKGLRIKLREMMNDSKSLGEKISTDHKEGLKRRYLNSFGEEPSEDLIENMMKGDLRVGVSKGKVDHIFVMKNQGRHQTVKEIQKRFTELHQVFLDMDLIIDEEQVNDNGEQNVTSPPGTYEDLEQADVHSWA